MRFRIGLLLTLCVGLGSAGTLSVNFDQVQLSGAPGDTLTYSGTLTNNTGALVYLNGVSMNLASFDPSDYDPTDFLLNAPFTLDVGVTSGDFDFFTVTIPAGFTPDVYIGSLDVQGGPTSSDFNDLGSGDFTVNVTGSAAPEPASWGLLPLGLAALVSRWRMRFGSGVLVEDDAVARAGRGR